MVRLHHRLNGCDFEQILGASKGQQSLLCYSSWGCKESDRTEQFNNTTEMGCANILEGLSHPTLTAQ